MASKALQGHCLCKAVQYAAGGEPLWCAHCHCGDCRRHTGSAVATFVCVHKAHFRLTAGELGRVESSPGVYRSFCSACGTPMTYERDDLPGEIHLYLGTLEHPEDMPPTLEVFCKERLPWLKLSVDGPSFESLPGQDKG